MHKAFSVFKKNVYNYLPGAHEVAHEAAAQHGQRVLVQLHAASRHRLHQHLPAAQRALQHLYVLLLHSINNAMRVIYGTYTSVYTSRACIIIIIIL
jgi:hypothetical protein